MTVEPMTEKDFVAMMDANVNVYPEWAALSGSEKIMLAKLNVCTGAAYSFMDKGMLLGVGGIRYVGLGEAWLVSVPDIKSLKLFRETAKRFASMRDELNLWRVFAEAHTSENFLQHLGFRKEETFVWTR